MKIHAVRSFYWTTLIGMTIVRMGITARWYISLCKIIYFYTSLWSIFPHRIYKSFGKASFYSNFSEDLNKPDWFYHHLFNNTSNHMNSENLGSEVDRGKFHDHFHFNVVTFTFLTFTFQGLNLTEENREGVFNLTTFSITFTFNFNVVPFTCPTFTF